MPVAVAHILKYFAYAHLPAALQLVSQPFHDLAYNLAGQAMGEPELLAALNRLLEAKDWAVRGKVSFEIEGPKS